MADLKEDYYFNYVPERERDSKSNIDWKVYNGLISVVLTYSSIEARLARFLAKWDLFPSAFNLLTILARSDGQGIHLSRISELLAVSRANVTGLVDVLARKQLVERLPSEKDRRVRLARLTPEGFRLIQEILPEYYAFNRGLCDSISDADMKTLFRVLRQMRAAINAQDGDALGDET
jgi:DNA-binding MarR family transcriptional regulator